MAALMGISAMVECWRQRRPHGSFGDDAGAISEVGGCQVMFLVSMVW